MAEFPHQGNRAEVRSPEERLDSWREISQYLRRTVRTVQRWEQREQLPVRRIVHDKRSTVYAYRAELDQWWQDREATRDGRMIQTGEVPVSSPERRPGIRLTGILLVAVFAAIVSAIWLRT